MLRILTLICIITLISCKNKNSNRNSTQLEGTSNTKKMTCTLPFFNEINIYPTRDYEIQTEVNNQKVSIDINFDEDEIDPIILDGVKRILNNIEEVSKQMDKEISKNYSLNGTVKDYIEHHIDELKKEELVAFLKKSDKSKSQEQQLLSKLNLYRIGFYPENTDSYVVFDFSIGTEITNYLISVKLDQNGKLKKVDFVS